MFTYISLVFFSVGMFTSANATTIPSPEGVNENEKLSIERFALYIASNKGGLKRETLKYAGTDAKKLSQTMNEIGGIRDGNSLILTDPTKAEIDKAFADFASLIQKEGGNAKRTEFLFYYSGHSDENSFLLGDEVYDYAELKDSLNKVPTDVHVVMLDSCFSGNFVRTKGGSRQKAFLMDDSAIVKGHAYLSSSADNEASQESDIIQASYFTQALVTGLRGAADSSGDGRVSLNELYYFAFNETLSSTETSTIGPQHPSYNITLVGSGDLVLTDLSEAEASVYIPAESEGKFFFRNKDNILVSEINKIKGTEIALALPAGFYSVTVVTGTVTKQRNFVLQKGERIPLESYTFGIVSRIPGRARGDEDYTIESETEEQAPPEPEEEINWTQLSVSIFPKISYPQSASTDNVNISLGVFMAQNKRILGVQASTFSGTITTDLFGVQASGFMNNNSGNTRGIQSAGFMNNSSGDILGVQASGFMNNSSGSIKGVQAAGFMNNVSGDLNGIQAAGFMNNASGNFKGAQIAGFMNTANKKLTGIQSSGFLNTAGNGFTGIQASGFLNIASASSEGIQGSGFLNITNEIHGLQVGVVNIARTNTGASIGILNIILNGIISPAVYVDSCDNVFIQYQGGTPKFFTTFLAGTNKNLEYDYGIFGFGLGVRFTSSRSLSMDLELLGKQVFDSSNTDMYEQDKPSDEMTDEEATKVAKIWAQNFMPSFRATLNMSFFKHFSLFGSFNLDGNIMGQNDKAFTYGSWNYDPYVFKKNEVQLYPSFSIGLKF